MLPCCLSLSFLAEIAEGKEEFAVGIDSQPAGDTLLFLEFITALFLGSR